MNYIHIEKNKPSKNSGKISGRLILFIVGMLLLITAIAFGGKNLFNPVSIVANIARANLKETDGRTNILLLGSDKRTAGVVTSELTDTILVVSVGRVEGDVVMISLPRDLWVQGPIGRQSKINEVYSYGGLAEIKNICENVLGMPIHYYAVVNFEIFKKAIDVVGGIEVNVENSFTDYFYPIEGKENAPRAERYETVTFEKGIQKMDGERALKFARSRKGDNGEGTDFARAARQQKVIWALKDKALSIDTLLNPTKLKEFYDLYKEQIETNVDLSDLQNFLLLTKEINFDKIISVVLDDRSAADQGGLLYNPENSELYGGAYVLLPKTGDFSQIHAYVQRFLFGQTK